MKLIKILNYCLKFPLIPTLTILSYFYFSQPVLAQDKSILLAPTRVVFEGRTRSATVKMINPNNRPLTYKISLVTIRSDDYGIKTETQSPNDEELFAQNMIRFSPRRATIPANGWQTIRLMVRKPKDLAKGEYRTQLKISTVPEDEKPENPTEQTNISIKIKIVFDVSIPIIVRHGKTDVDIIPHSPQIITKNQQIFLETTLERKGLYSIFADVRAFFTPLTGDKQRVNIGENRGISIYAQNKNQIVHIPINNKDVLTKGKIDIEVINREKQDAPLLGSGSFELN